MRANLDISEPKPSGDDDSPLTFTMEGYKGIPPSAITPFFWSPGWNSVQSVTKFQKEPGGPLKDGDPGIPLFRERREALPGYFRDIPESFFIRQNKWLVLPQYDALGSGELSSYSKSIEQLSPVPSATLSEEDAVGMGLTNGSFVKITADKNQYILPVKINKLLSKGLALVSAGFSGMGALYWGEWMKIERVTEIG
jgi:NADH-quinone oxidoreductase subunit G